MAPEANWAGSYVYRARTIHAPETVEQLQELVAATPRIRVLGSRHTFSDIADSEELVSLAALPADVTVDGTSVTVGGGVRYGEIAPVLDRAGLALHNLASLPHISVAGAVATATHGSGDGNGNLATAVSGLEVVTADGEIVRVARGDPDFDGMVVNVGALGAVARLTLDAEPAYEVRQRVFEGIGWDELLEHYDAVTATGYSVSVFTLWGDTSQVWVKSRDDGPAELLGRRAATEDRHPIPGIDPVNCTAQRGLPGPWWDRLPHFRMGFMPSVGEELQSELHFPRRHVAAAIEAVRALADRVQPVLQVCEIRTIAADRLWLSPQYEQDSAAMHFTWIRDQEAVERVLVDLEAALAPFDARPHWGKLFLHAPRHPRTGEFLALAARLDPDGKFRNGWFERHVVSSQPSG
jgi:alditol oxidase